MRWTHTSPPLRNVVVSIMGVLGASALLAQEDPERESLQVQVDTLRRDLDEARQEARELAVVVGDSGEWRQVTSAFHLAGYASAGYTDVENETGVFSTANFNPVFHFQYRDRILWEAELEFEIEENGETETNLEYSSIDIFLNDYLTLLAGKFLSPLGYFRQNLHPAWVNKLPSAPPGFGHDGAAPEAEIGFQLRGGAPVGTKRLNYALYLGNGPELEAEDGEVHSILTGGFTRDADGEKVLGGRLGFEPSLHLEIGLTAAVGDTSVTADDGVQVQGEPARNYEALGVDFAYHWTNAGLRGHPHRSARHAPACGKQSPATGRREIPGDHARCDSDHRCLPKAPLR